MTGRRFHRTTEAIPRRPWKSTSPFASRPMKINIKRGTRGVRARYDVALPPFISIVRSPWSSGHIGPREMNGNSINGGPPPQSGKKKKDSIIDNPRASYRAENPTNPKNRQKIPARHTNSPYSTGSKNISRKYQKNTPKLRILLSLEQAEASFSQEASRLEPCMKHGKLKLV